MCESPPPLLAAFRQRNIHQHRPLLLSPPAGRPRVPRPCGHSRGPPPGGTVEPALLPQGPGDRWASWTPTLTLAADPPSPPPLGRPRDPPLSPTGTLPALTPDVPPDNTRPPRSLRENQATRIPRPWGSISCPLPTPTWRPLLLARGSPASSPQPDTQQGLSLELRQPDRRPPGSCVPHRPACGVTCSTRDDLGDPGPVQSPRPLRDQAQGIRKE